VSSTARISQSSKGYHVVEGAGDSAALLRSPAFIHPCVALPLVVSEDDHIMSVVLLLSPVSSQNHMPCPQKSLGQHFSFGQFVWSWLRAWASSWALFVLTISRRQFWHYSSSTAVSYAVLFSVRGVGDSKDVGSSGAWAAAGEGHTMDVGLGALTGKPLALTGARVPALSAFLCSRWICVSWLAVVCRGVRPQQEQRASGKNVLCPSWR
jgi:hypothetical protein